VAGPVLAGLVLVGLAATALPAARSLGAAEALARVDRGLLLSLRDGADPADTLGPIRFEEAVRDLTALGSTIVLIGLSATVALWFALTGRRREALFAVLVPAGAGGLGELLKQAFARLRPDLVPHAMHAAGWSFPSSHALMSTATFLTLGALLGLGQERRSVRFYLLALGGGLALVVGTSRVYLGVHWPTDVLAGWLTGGAWAALCWRVGRTLGVGAPDHPS
jgi:undecaprenyl-diphosphatase